MGAILDWFKNFGEFLGGILDLIGSIFRGMGDMARLLTQILPKIPDYFMWLPDSCLYLVVAAFSIAVVYKILGREG